MSLQFLLYFVLCLACFITLICDASYIVTRSTARQNQLTKRLADRDITGFTYECNNISRFDLVYLSEPLLRAIKKCLGSLCAHDVTTFPYLSILLSKLEELGKTDKIINLVQNFMVDNITKIHHKATRLILLFCRPDVVAIQDVAFQLELQPIQHPFTLHVLSQYIKRSRLQLGDLIPEPRKPIFIISGCTTKFLHSHTHHHHTSSHSSASNGELQVCGRTMIGTDDNFLIMAESHGDQVNRIVDQMLNFAIDHCSSEGNLNDKPLGKIAENWRVPFTFNFCASVLSGEQLHVVSNGRPTILLFRDVSQENINLIEPMVLTDYHDGTAKSGSFLTETLKTYLDFQQSLGIQCRSVKLKHKDLIVLCSGEIREDLKLHDLQGSLVYTELQDRSAAFDRIVEFLKAKTAKNPNSEHAAIVFASIIDPNITEDLQASLVGIPSPSMSSLDAHDE